MINCNNVAVPRHTILLQPSTATSEAYPTLDKPVTFKEYFDHEGFIVIRQALASDLCEAAKQAFLREALPDSRAFFVRHASGTYERHVYTDQGFMKFPIMNLQDISGKRYPLFKKRGLELLTQANIKRALDILFGEPGRLVHTMYFDGNQTTWAHRDGHYIDSEQIGRMVGVWIAAEDIHPDSGRFFVVPGSHHIAVPGEWQNPNGDSYKAMMADFIREGPLDCVSPILKQGDVLLWSSLTIHGSLPTANPKFSRRSFTGHYVPQSHQFKRHLARNGRPDTITVNDVAIALNGERHTLVGNLKNTLRSEFPNVFWLLRSSHSHFKRLRDFGSASWRK